ncbi:MAG: very short patch repair endonuclease [Planctomycetota bacterium]
MADVFTKAKRSEVMSRIRSRGNRGTELRLISIFRLHGIGGWRRNRPVFGRPDFVFPAGRVAVFVDGCFWHGCPRHYTAPAGHAAFWRRKLVANRTRDRLVTRTLTRAGWKVLRIWEHALTGDGRRVAARVLKMLASRLP